MFLTIMQSNLLLEISTCAIVPKSKLKKFTVGWNRGCAVIPGLYEVCLPHFSPHKSILSPLALLMWHSEYENQTMMERAETNTEGAANSQWQTCPLLVCRQRNDETHTATDRSTSDFKQDACWHWSSSRFASICSIANGTDPYSTSLLEKCVINSQRPVWVLINVF